VYLREATLISQDCGREGFAVVRARCGANERVLISVAPDKDVDDHPNRRTATEYGWLSFGEVLAGNHFKHELWLALLMC
jgi:hypothetical protein